MGTLRVQEVRLGSGRQCWTILWPEGAVHEEADRYLRGYDGEPGTQRTYAYLLVDHLRWLEREALDLDAVTIEDLKRYMGVLGAEVRMPFGEPWRLGKRPYSKTTLSTTASVLKMFYIGLATQVRSAGLSLQLARDDIRQTTNLLSDETPAELGLDEDIATARARMKQRLAELQAAAAAAGLDSAKVPGWRLNMTEMIKTVSELVHADNRGDADTRHGASLLWRLQSGHAHGTPSARVRQINPNRVRQHHDGTLTGAATASFAEVGSAAAAAVLFLNEAWRLYELRCTAP